MIIYQADCALAEIEAIHPRIFGETFPTAKFNAKQNAGISIMCYGFYSENTLVGYAMVQDISAEKRWHFWLGGMLPEHQAKGYFSGFCDWMMNQAREHQCQSITCNTDNNKPYMLSILISRGFDIIGTEETSYGDGIKIRLRYSIQPSTNLRLSITSACNLNCFFCHHDGVVLEEPMHLRIPQIERILVQAKKASTREITITGGEPCCYFAGIDYILKYCNHWLNPPHIKIATNGILWTQSMMERLNAYSGKITMNVSFHSAEENCFAKIYGQPLLMQQYEQFFGWARQYGIAVRANATVLDGINNTPAQLWTLLSFLHCHGVSAVNLMELLVQKNQYDLLPYYYAQSDMEQALLQALQQCHSYRLVSQKQKKTSYEVCFQHSETPFYVSIYRLSCRSGCEHCQQENDLTIGADGKGHPCYLDADVCCGDATISLPQTIAQCHEYIAQKDSSYSQLSLYWGK